MKAITASQAYEIANRALQERKQEEKELQEAFNLIRERAEMGQFWAHTRECLSQSNINLLKSLGFDAFNIYDTVNLTSKPRTNIVWYDEKEQK